MRSEGQVAKHSTIAKSFQALNVHIANNRAEPSQEAGVGWGVEGHYGVEGMDAGTADQLRAHWVALGRWWVQVGEG